jgi:hypothetical protein
MQEKIMMNAKEYADILKFAIELQIGYVKEDMENAIFYDENYFDGMITGLRMAIQKIESSSFLFE